MVSLSSRDTEFLSTVRQWIAQRGEVLVMLRYSRAAGSKDFEFFDSVELLNSCQLPAQVIRQLSAR
jgi:hypothetical protein